MDEIRTTGKTVDDALTEALIQLGTTSDQVEYDVIEKGSPGFFGLGSKLAVIEVRRKKQEKAESKEKNFYEAKAGNFEKKKAPYETKAVKEEKKETPYEAKAVKEEKKEVPYKTKAVKEEKKEAPYEAKTKKAEESFKVPVAEETEQKPVKPVTPLDGEKVKEQINAFLGEIFKIMNMDVDIQYQIEEETRIVSIEMKGSDMGVLIGKRGQTLDSLQYLISLVVNKDTNEYIRVKLDTENYRRRRRATLENLAKNIAFKVKRERKPITLEPMNPYERRIIHSALQNDRYVETHSEGAEPYRRVVVSLKK